MSITTINVTITAEQFITIYGQSEFCRSFTDSGIRTVLEEIAEQQECTGEAIIDWTGFFMECSEYTDSDLVREYMQLVDEETQNNAEDISEVVDAILESIGRRYRVTDADTIILFD